MDPALGIKPNPRADGYGDNPRCHRRDVNNFFTKDYLKPSDLLKHITSSHNISKFQDELQMTTPTIAALHIGGHFSIWGDPGGDVFVSPNEPAFWLHHGQLDRHWWMWANYQDKELLKRTSQYEGKYFDCPCVLERIMADVCDVCDVGATNWMEPNGPRGKNTDPQWLSIAAPPGMDGIQSKEMFSTTAGPWCYVYQ